MSSETEQPDLHDFSSETSSSSRSSKRNKKKGNLPSDESSTVASFESIVKRSLVSRTGPELDKELVKEVTKTIADKEIEIEKYEVKNPDDIIVDESELKDLKKHLEDEIKAEEYGPEEEEDLGEEEPKDHVESLPLEKPTLSTSDTGLSAVESDYSAKSIPDVAKDIPSLPEIKPLPEEEPLPLPQLPSPPIEIPEVKQVEIRKTGFPPIVFITYDPTAPHRPVIQPRLEPIKRKLVPVKKPPQRENVSQDAQQPSIKVTCPCSERKPNTNLEPVEKKIKKAKEAEKIPEVQEYKPPITVTSPLLQNLKEKPARKSSRSAEKKVEKSS